jgi:hypothetical protein
MHLLTLRAHKTAATLNIRLELNARPHLGIRFLTRLRVFYQPAGRFPIMPVILFTSFHRYNSLPHRHTYAFPNRSVMSGGMPSRVPDNGYQFQATKGPNVTIPPYHVNGDHLSLLI